MPEYACSTAHIWGKNELTNSYLIRSVELRIGGDDGCGTLVQGRHEVGQPGGLPGGRLLVRGAAALAHHDCFVRAPVYYFNA